MKLAKEFASSGLDGINAALNGGVLKLYTVARPSSPDVPVTRSDLVAVYQFASPAFSANAPQFTSNPVNAEHAGTPGFARAFKADGVTPVADFSAGPGITEIKLLEVTATAEYPLTIASLKLELPAA